VSHLSRRLSRESWPTDKILLAEIAALRVRLDPELNPDLAPFDTGRAFALYEKIVAPVAALLDGARQVFVIPDGAFDSLPFGVLVTKPPAHSPDQPADHRDIAWLAREHALAVLPAVGSLRALRQSAAGGNAPAPFVGIGDPTLKGKPGLRRAGVACRRARASSFCAALSVSTSLRST
jgi:CHAT domain